MNHFLENLKYTVGDLYYPKKNQYDIEPKNNNFFSNNWITFNGYRPYNTSNSKNSDGKQNKLFNSLSLILLLTVIIVSSIMIYFNDDYIKFKLSFLNKKMKRLDSREIYDRYYNWYRKFVKRTRTFFYIKMYGIITLLCFIISYFLEFEEHMIIISFSLFCLSFVVYTYKYYIYYYYEYFENERKLYDLLIYTIEQKISRKQN